MSDERTLRLLAALTVAVGFLIAVDAVPAAKFEFVLGVAAMAGGVGLLRRHRYANHIAVLAAVAGLVHSAIALIQLAPNLFNLLTILAGGSDPRLWSEYGSRLVLIFIQVLFWPILLGLLYIDLQCRSPEDPKIRRAKRAFWTCAGAAVLLSVMIEFMLHR